MDMLQWIKSRRSTRKYLDRPVEDEKLTQVVEAGRYAPSGGNNQTTHFLVIRDPEVLAELAELVKRQFASMEETPGMYKSRCNAIRAAKTGNYHFCYHAPALIVTANRKEYGNNMADCSCALENMMLMANALDLGSCWINQLRWLNEDPEVVSFLEKLGLREDEVVCGALAVGYADTEDGLPNREPLPRTGNEVTII